MGGSWDEGWRGQRVWGPCQGEFGLYPTIKQEGAVEGFYSWA